MIVQKYTIEVQHFRRMTCRFLQANRSRERYTCLSKFITSMRSHESLN